MYVNIIGTMGVYMCVYIYIYIYIYIYMSTVCHNADLRVKPRVLKNHASAAVLALSKAF